MAAKSKSMIDWRKLAKALIDEMEQQEAQEFVAKCLKDDDNQDDDDDDDDDQDDQRDDEEDDYPDEEADEAEAAAGGPLTARPVVGHRLYLTSAKEAKQLKGAILAAGGGYIAQRRRGGKLVAVLTDCRAPALRGKVVPPARATLIDRLLCRRGGKVGGSWLRPVGA